MNKMVYFSENLKYLRKQTKKSRLKTSNELGVHHKTLFNWEQGMSAPSLWEILNLADYYKIGLDDLFYKDLSKDEGL